MMIKNILKAILEAMRGLSLNHSQVAFEQCISRVDTPEQTSISSRVVDDAFEAYKNMSHSVLSTLPCFQFEWQREIEKQAMSVYWDKKKELCKRVLMSKRLLI